MTSMLCASALCDSPNYNVFVRLYFFGKDCYVFASSHCCRLWLL